MVLAMLIPVVISQGFIIGFGALGPMLVSGAGIEAISAVSTVEYINAVTLGTFVSVAAAGSVLVAQCAGKGDTKQMTRAGAATLWSAAAPAALVGGALVAFHRPLLDALVGPAGQAVVDHARVYLIAAAASYPAHALVEAASAAMRGVGHTRPTLFLTVTMNGGTLLLAAGLIYGAHLAVAGLAISLVVSRYLAAGLALWWYKHDTRLGVGVKTGRPDLAMIGRVFHICVPFVLENLFFNGGKLVIQFFVVSLGTGQITINAVGQGLISLCEMAPQAMIIGIVPLVGQAIGAGRPREARRVILSFITASVVVSCAVTVVVLAAFPWLLNLYHTPSDLRGDVMKVFLLAALGRVTFLWAMSYILPSGLRAAGDAVYSTIVATGAMAFRVAGAWFMAVHLGYGTVGVWVAMVVEWGLRSALYGARLLSGRWEHKSFVA
jgi:Na+-driven multidrug efflux pump